MIGLFTKNGKRKRAAKHVYSAVLVLSYIYNISPVLVLEEVVVKNLPTFLLKKYIVKRVQIKQYPVLAKKEKKIQMTIRWVCNLIKKKVVQEREERQKHRIKKDPLYLTILAELEGAIYTRRGAELNSMLKNYTKAAVQNAHNVRFN